MPTNYSPTLNNVAMSLFFYILWYVFKKVVEMCMLTKFTAGVKDSIPYQIAINVSLPFTLADPPLRPLVDASVVKLSSISLKWEEPWSHLPIRNYTLELLNAQGQPLRTIIVPNRSLGGPTTYRVSGLAGATRYRFRLRANSDAGSGAWSDVITENTPSSEE